MNNRIRELRKTLGLRQREFAERIGLKQNAISYMEKNGSTVTEQNIKSICSQFNVNEHWLRDGTGGMFIEQTKDEQIATFMGDLLRNEEDSFKRRLISGLCGLDDKGWETLEKFIDSIQKKD